jgi:hypothetical protein
MKNSIPKNQKNKKRVGRPKTNLFTIESGYSLQAKPGKMSGGQTHKTVAENLIKTISKMPVHPNKSIPISTDTHPKYEQMRTLTRKTREILKQQKSNILFTVQAQFENSKDKDKKTYLGARIWRTK